MKSKLLGVIITIPLLIGAAAFLITRSAQSQSVATTLLTPFTAQITERSTHIHTGNTMEMQKYLAVDADGSRSYGDSGQTTAPAWRPVRTVKHVPTATAVMIDDHMQTLMSGFLTAANISVLRRVPKDRTCREPDGAPGVPYEVKRHERFLGFETVVIELQHDNAVRTRWEAPALDCNPLKETEELKDQSGIVTDRFERYATEVRVGTPDPSLFSIPAGYKETPPSRRYPSVAAREGLVLSNTQRERFRKMDDEYFQNWENASRQGRELSDEMKALLAMWKAGQ